MDLIDQLQTLANRAEQASESLTNEEATKMALIAPFIQALGYDIFNPVEVKPEFSADLPGIKLFQFFSDLDDRNLMDQKPFAEIDLFDLRSAPIEQIKQMSKTMFDIDNLLSSAERLKYLRGVKEEIKTELSDPSDWFVREMAVRVHSAQRITGQLQEKFKPIVIDAIKAYINDRINEGPSTAMQVEKSAAEAPVVE